MRESSLFQKQHWQLKYKQYVTSFLARVRINGLLVLYIIVVETGEAKQGQEFGGAWTGSTTLAMPIMWQKSWSHTRTHTHTN